VQINDYDHDAILIEKLKIFNLSENQNAVSLTFPSNRSLLENGFFSMLSMIKSSP